jgi:transposase
MVAFGAPPTSTEKAGAPESPRPQNTERYPVRALRTRCRWQDVPREYGSPATCWRRLRRWEEEGIWERIWHGLLALLDEQEKLEWARAFLDGCFIPAKKGELVWAELSVAKAPRQCS